MSSPLRQKRVFRFAPSPNGPLHLGHALSALLNHDMVRDTDGRFLLRLEDIDQTRCTPQFEHQMIDDLTWLGLEWEQPVRRQSEHFEDYRAALARLIDMGLAYPSFMSRGDIKSVVASYEAGGRQWPRDPDGAPLYPDNDRQLPTEECDMKISAGLPHAWRLNMQRAVARIPFPLQWVEYGLGEKTVVDADPSVWGDVVLSRSDAPSSYHLSVVVDDALQGVTDVMRGQDLFASTAIHRLLQELLGLSAPLYYHHHLVLGADGRKLSKSEGSTGLSVLRGEGKAPSDIRRLLGL